MDQKFDVFLSHSKKDTEVVRELAERLKEDGVKVWFDEWAIQLGDCIPAKINEGLESSRILALCMSANAFGSDWASLESYTFQFRDPLNKERRFLPLRLDDAPIKASLTLFQHLDWRPGDREKQYPKLLESCRPRSIETPSSPRSEIRSRDVIVGSLGHTGTVNCVAWHPDGKLALSASDDKTVRLWEVESGHCLGVLEGHAGGVHSVAWSPDGKQALSGSNDGTIRLWDVVSGRCLRVLKGHTEYVNSVAWSPDGKQALSGSNDRTIRLWDVMSGRYLGMLEGHTDNVRSVGWSPDGKRALSASDDKTVRIWELESGRCLRTLEGHTDGVSSVAWSPDGKCMLSASFDTTVRIWELESGRCLHTLTGHKYNVFSVAWNSDGKQALSASVDRTVRLWDVESGDCLRTLEGHTDSVLSVAWSLDGKHALSGGRGATVRLWDVESGRCLRMFEGHMDGGLSVAWSPNGQLVVTGSSDNTIRVWEVKSGRCRHTLMGPVCRVLSVMWSPDGKRALSGGTDMKVWVWDVERGHRLHALLDHRDIVLGVAWSPDGKRAISASLDNTVRVWDVESGDCLRALEGHTDCVYSVAWSPDGRLALSGSKDNTVRVWDVESGDCLCTLEAHTDIVESVAWSPDAKRALTGSRDRTVRVWDVESACCLRTLEGHTDFVESVAWSPDGQRAVTGSHDTTVRVWDVESGRCLRTLEGHTDTVMSLAWSSDSKRVRSAARNGVWREWDLEAYLDANTTSPVDSPKFVEYTNAKVLLVGDSGVGKTGLSNRLALGKFQETESTDGAWATHWPLPQSGSKAGADREVWLWDFAGQVDYRLVHQVFMDDTTVAVLVFNPQQENPFESLGHWDHDLQKSARRRFAKLLAAGRVDRGGLVVNDESIKRFMSERGFVGAIHHTSSKTGKGCDELRQAIEGAIDWDSLPKTTSPVLYRQLKQEILSLRDSGIVLIRLAELNQRMEMTLRKTNFELSELETVVSLLAGPGMIQRLDFGGFILLRPEILSRYASAVVRRVRSHPDQLGCIREDELLAGNLDYQDFERLPREDEAVVLRALLETFINRSWCLRQPCDGSAMLIFPSYFRRERPNQPSHPNVMMTYRFDGHTDDIYATLVVRLHHTVAFESKDLWKSAADFKTQMGATLGFTLTRESEGTSHLEVYFEPDVDMNSRVVFLRYVHEHLVRQAKNVVRLRNYFCMNGKCKNFERPFMDREAIDEAIAPGGEGRVFCGKCGGAITLRDVIEEKFDSPVVKETARKMDAEAQTAIDKESLRLILLGHAFAITSEAGQIFRPITNSEHGIDGEIEFRNDQGEPSGKRLLLAFQRKADDFESEDTFGASGNIELKGTRAIEGWLWQKNPVMFVLRLLNGEIRWSELWTEKMREHTNLRRILRVDVSGERFDVMSVRRWRERVLYE